MVCVVLIGFAPAGAIASLAGAGGAAQFADDELVEGELEDRCSALRALYTIPEHVGRVVRGCHW